MAGEIGLSANLFIKNGSFEFIQNISISVDQATAGGGNPGTLIIGTSEEDITFTDITTAGWLFMKNLDATNFVKWGPKNVTMQEMGRLEAGEFALFRYAPTGVTLRMIADTAACDVQICLFRD